MPEILRNPLQKVSSADLKKGEGGCWGELGEAGGGWDQLGPSEAAGGSARATGNDESVSSSLISNYFT